jgi:hypothetical protein
MTDEQIITLADNLECGLRCFVHKESRKIVTIPEAVFETGNDSEEFWEKSFKEIEKDINSYFVIERMQTHESFKLMEKFADLVENKILQQKLVLALNKPKPFSNFKYEVENSGSYKQRWYDFKKQQLIEWVKRQLTEKDL